MPATSSSEHDALPPGTRFGEFEIVRVLAVGGFGIVYLARDLSLERDVALKEYMPASLASRGEGPQITIRSSSFAETYAIGLRSFINEARLLARFDHPSLVKVYRFWEDNATAYMVMPYLQGVTLRDARRGMARAPDEAWIRSVLDPILSVLELLHREDVYHRDIAPDNILLPPEGPPVLLDFGAARRVISDHTQSLTAILKPRYAPIEQYAEMAQLRQGPWTDLYALGAVVHYLLFGVPPQPATARALQDDGASIADRSVPGVSPRMLQAVAWALAIRPSERPQCVAEFRGALDGRVEIPPFGRPRSALPGSRVPPTDELPPGPCVESGLPAPARHSVAPPAVGQGAPVPAAPIAVAVPIGARRAPSAVTAESASALGYVFAGLGVVAVAAGVAIWLFGMPNDTVSAGAPAASAATATTLSSPALADARPGPTRVAASPSPVTAVPVVPATAPALQAAVVIPSTTSASIAASSARADRLAAAAPSSSEPKVAAAIPPAAAASRPKAATRKPDAGLPPVAEAGTEYTAPSARSRSAPAREVPATGPAAAEPDGPTSARQACGSRAFLARAICMDRECEQPRFRSTAECIPILERKRARENR